MRFNIQFFPLSRTPWSDAIFRLLYCRSAIFVRWLDPSLLFFAYVCLYNAVFCSHGSAFPRPICLFISAALIWSFDPILVCSLSSDSDSEIRFLISPALLLSVRSCSDRNPESDPDFNLLIQIPSPISYFIQISVLIFLIHISSSILTLI